MMGSIPNPDIKIVVENDGYNRDQNPPIPTLFMETEQLLNEIEA